MKHISSNLMLCITLLVTSNAYSMSNLQALAVSFILPLCILNRTIPETQAASPIENLHAVNQNLALEASPADVSIPILPIPAASELSHISPIYTMIAQHAPCEIDEICNKNNQTNDVKSDCRHIEKILYCVYHCNRTESSWATEKYCKNFEQTTHVANLARKQGKNENEVATLLTNFKAAMISLNEMAQKEKKEQNN